MARLPVRLLEIMLQPATRIPVLTLALVSALAISLVGMRMVLTHTLRHGYLVWNLFLAWLPLLFSLSAVHLSRSQGTRHWKFWFLAIAWLLFLPNAPYIFTDLVHLGTRAHRLFWVDLTLIVLCAWTASLLGFLSLFTMQTLVRRSYGLMASWAFVVVISGLTGCGIFIGRFLRWNSWDVLVNPFGLAAGIVNWVFTSLTDQRLIIYPALFGMLFFAAHVTLTALLHLR